MATISFKGGDEYALKLSRLATGSEEIAKKAIYQGAKVVADKISQNLNALPEEKFRFLRDGDKFSGVPARQKQDLINSFGITPIARDSDGNWNAKIGFDGYGSAPTKKYPKGVPNQLLARSIESGSSVRHKRPFVRPAVNATRKKAIEAMGNVIDEEISKMTGGV
jgi:hypothetical protein